MSGGRTILVGVSWWNRPTMRALLVSEASEIEFQDDVASAIADARRDGARLVAWASKMTPADMQMAQASGIALTYAEDGFLRSVGLGAGLTRGGCYVLDGTGIYYDARRPSDIETLLETADLGADEVSRAGDLRRQIRSLRLSKYNVGHRTRLPTAPIGRERILVVGQVAADAGVRCTLSATLDCAHSSNINLDLLETARQAYPRAYIVYKPHPDVAADLRPGHIDAATVARLADVTVADADVIDLIEACDRVFTLSSLTGFEALLRGKAVTVHGLPFYAGWGLTEDATPCPRRTRRRTVDELIAVALLRYCRYVDPVTLQACSAEAMIQRLGSQRESPVHRIGARLRQHASWAGRKLGL